MYRGRGTGAPASPPIPRPRYIQKDLDTPPQHHQQPHNATVIVQPVALTPPSPCVNAPRLHPMPPPRMIPRISARLTAAAPRVAPHLPTPHVTTTQPPTGPATRTRSKNPDFRTVAQESMFSFATLNLLNLSPARLAGRRFPLKRLNAVLNEKTGEIVEYQQLMKSPKYRNLYKNSYSKELGIIAQGIPDVVKGTYTIFFHQ